MGLFRIINNGYVTEEVADSEDQAAAHFIEVEESGVDLGDCPLAPHPRATREILPDGSWTYFGINVETVERAARRRAEFDFV